MPVIAVMFWLGLKSWAINCIQPSVLGFVWQWNLIRFVNCIAVPMHIHQHRVWGGIEVQTAHHKIFEQRVPGSFPKAQVKKSLLIMALIFQDKSWLLKLISHEHYGKLSAYSVKFMRETALKVEDVLCVFELY
ncbi:hypothetical protein BT93_G0591 [Corymbia citriodora subsp. variegata]|nr:hypothetical protein BT93_G0591 [Corymbia citriodora subsp. variegata]